VITFHPLSPIYCVSSYFIIILKGKEEEDFFRRKRPAPYLSARAAANGTLNSEFLLILTIRFHVTAVGISSVLLMPLAPYLKVD